MIHSTHIQEKIALAKTGDQVAFTAILNFYWNEVYNFMLKRTGNETDAEDITIETFSKAFDKIIAYNPEFAFNTWLIAIGKNVHIDLLRKRKTSHFIEMSEEEEVLYQNIADDSPTIEDELIYEQNLASLKHYIKQLKPHYQEIIQLRYFQEMTYNEISEEIKEPLNNVKVKLLRAKKLLIEMIRNNKP